MKEKEIVLEADEQDDPPSRFDVMLREAEAFVAFPESRITDADKRVAYIVAKFALQVLDAKQAMVDRDLALNTAADQSRVIDVLTEALAVIRSSDELEEIGTPCCNCGRLADHIADAIDKALVEAKRIQEGK